MTLWLKKHRFSEDADFNLICFPYAGGNAHVFSMWKNFVPSNINIIGVQFPGRSSLASIPSCTNIHQLVYSLYPHIKQFIQFNNLIFFGHSLGALVAFELCKYFWKNDGFLPEILILSACSAPKHMSKRPGIYHLPDIEFIEKIKHYGGTSEEILNDSSLVEFFVPMLKSDFCIYETYKAEESPHLCPINLTAMGSLDDPYANLNDMLSWKDYVLGNYNAVEIKGNHFYVNPYNPSFAEKLLNELSRLFKPCNKNYGTFR